uniref:(northern house mosquito) hypothetical protein n=1 Tax=Culex pipiens TaxID=7175 RepID=A0A8D8KAH8_CULPI
MAQDFAAAVHVRVLPGDAPLGAVRDGVFVRRVAGHNARAAEPRCVPHRHVHLPGGADCGVPRDGHTEVQIDYYIFRLRRHRDILPTTVDNVAGSTAGGPGAVRHVHGNGGGLLHVHLRQDQPGPISTGDGQHAGRHPQRSVPGERRRPNPRVNRDDGPASAQLHHARCANIFATVVVRAASGQEQRLLLPRRQRGQS